MSISGISSSDYLYELYKLLSATQSDSSSSDSQSTNSAFSTLVEESSNSQNSSNDLSSLLQALEVNKFMNAQNSSLSQFQQNSQDNGTSDALNTSVSSIASNSTDSTSLKNDVKSMGDALSSGDPSTAQNIFAAVMQPMQSQPLSDSASSTDTTNQAIPSSGVTNLSDAPSGRFGVLSTASSPGDLSETQSSFSERLKDTETISAPGSVSATDMTASYSNLDRKNLFETLTSLGTVNQLAGTINTSA